MINMLLFLSLCIFLYVYNPIISILFTLYILLTKSFKFKMLLVLGLCLFVFRTSINACQAIESGKVVELNDKSIIVNHNFTNILVSVNDVSQYALQDEIIFYDRKNLEFSPHSYGFNFEKWTKSRNICYKANEQDTFKIKGKGILNWISKGGFNSNQTFIKYSRSLLFQSSPDLELDLFISMGIVYTLIIKLIKLCFLKQKNELVETIVISSIFFYLCINLAWPSTLIRVWIFYLSSRYIEDSMLKFSLNLIILAVINPFGLSQLAYVLPLTLQFSALFFPLKSRFIQRSLVLVVVLISFNHSYSLLNILIYPLLFILYRTLIIISLVLMIFPFFNTLYVNGVSHIDELYKLSLNFGLIKGHISIGFLVGFIVIYHILRHHKYYQLILTTLYMMFGIQLFSIPFFYTITMINVGQGDSFLIQAPFNQSVALIDTGSPHQYGALKSILDAQSIVKIDHLIVTHDDSDHSGNVDRVLKEYTVTEIIIKGKDIEDDWFFLNYLKFKQSLVDDNDASLVYYLKLYNTKFLFLGDLSTKGEVQLLSAYPYLSTDVLKLAHHGSKTSTSDDLLKQLRPRIGLISAGVNTYGHPSFEVIARLNDYTIHAFNSQLEGDVKIILTPLFRFVINSNYDLYFF